MGLGFDGFQSIGRDHSPIEGGEKLQTTIKLNARKFTPLEDIHKLDKVERVSIGGS